MKVVENWLSSICGVFGFGIAWTISHWEDVLLRITVAAFSALIAGGMGYIGKLITVWLIKKLKSIHSKIIK